MFGGSHDKLISEELPKDHVNVDPLLIGHVFENKAKNSKMSVIWCDKKEI